MKEKLKQQIEGKEGEIAAQATTINELKTQLHTFKKEHAVIVDSNSEFTQNMKLKENEIATLKNSINNMKEEIEQNDGKITSLNVQIKSTTSSLTKATTDLNEANNNNQKLTHTMKILTERETLTKDLAEENNTTINLLTKTVEDNNDNIKEKTARIDALSNDLLISHKDKLRLTGEKAAREASLTKLEAELTLQKGTIEKLTSEKTKLELYAKQSLHKFQNKFLVALSNLKEKLKEKQDKIERLEGERVVQKREERLITGSIYELGLEILKRQNIK